jgi:hypothetical protein
MRNRERNPLDAFALHEPADGHHSFEPSPAREITVPEKTCVRSFCPVEQFLVHVDRVADEEIGHVRLLLGVFEELEVSILHGILRSLAVRRGCVILIAVVATRRRPHDFR